jgi:hypothetical protein
MKLAILPTVGLISLFAPGLCPAQQADRSKEVAKITDAEINLMRKDLRDQKKQVVAANLPLTGDEAAKFWPVYDQYTQETVKINDQRYALVKEYAANYSTMTDAQASSYVRRWLQVDGAATQLRLDWVPKFEQLIGAKKAAIFFQIDRRTGMMIELQLSSQLPLVQP